MKKTREKSARTVIAALSVTLGVTLSVTVLNIVALTMATSACKPLATGMVKTAAYIIGPDNIRRIENRTPTDPAAPAPSDEMIKRVAATAVLIVTPLTTGETRFCSGNIYKTANGPVVLSNRHCFASDKNHSSASSGVDPWACEKTQVYREFDLSTAQPNIRTGCKSGSLLVNPLLDVAVFKLVDGGIENGLELRTSDPTPTERLRSLIVHFPDIEANRIRMDLTKFPGAPATVPRMAITFEDCATAGYFRSNTFEVDPSLPYSIRHTCDMIKGSSGSSLVDATSGESLGVNWGGIKFGDAGDAEAYNIATRSSLVASFISMAEIDLGKLLLALAAKPPEGVVGDGTADATTERSGKSRQPAFPGCAKISGNGFSAQSSPGNTHDSQHLLDSGWLLLAALGFAIGFRRNGQVPAQGAAGTKPASSKPASGT